MKLTWKSNGVNSVSINVVDDERDVVLVDREKVTILWPIGRPRAAHNISSAF
jgi:hypothetical protein